MTTEGQGEAQDVLVIEDSSGNLYLIRQETLEGGRVSDEYKDTLKQAVTGDVSGFAGGGDFQFAPSAQKFQLVEAFSVRLPLQAGGRQIADALRYL